MKRFLMFFCSCIVVILLCGAMVTRSLERSFEKDNPQFVKPDAIYVINKTIDLNGKTIKLPHGCSLKFEKGGAFANGVIVGDETKIVFARAHTIFLDCQLKGTWNVLKVYPQWFGAKADGKTDCTQALRDVTYFLHRIPYCTIFFPKGVYLISGVVFFDVPCKINGRKATIKTVENFSDKYAFHFSKYTNDGFKPNDTLTDICINFKTYSVPIGFDYYNKVYMHDCTVSTFSSTERGYPYTKFWFAIDCSRFYDAVFKNIRIDQPVCYKKNEFNSADGLHLMGQCHDIVVDNLHGFAGDDFIALNASETGRGDIFNVEIKNCVMGTKKKPTKNGIRIYSHNKEQLTVRNISINKCIIYPDNSPAIYVSNSPSGIMDINAPKLLLRNIIVNDCVFYAPRYEYMSKMHPSIIRFAGVDADSVFFNNIKAYANKDSLTYFINVMDHCDFKDVEARNCSFEGRNAYSHFVTKDEMQHVKFINLNN